MLPDQLPAPLPAIVYGDVKRAKKDLAYSVRHLARAVRDGYKIVCSEPSAALCLKEELRHYVDGEDAALVSQNTYELMSYLRDLYRHGRLKNPGVKPSREVENPQAGLGAKYGAGFVYHLPCHLCAVGGEGASIELLQGLCGVKVMDLAAGCCGLAGTFGMQKKNYELSSQIAAGLKDALDRSPTRQVLTECAACKMQIEHISGYNILHPIKVLAGAYY
jgi:Fe-S oxidoreductase